MKYITKKYSSLCGDEKHIDIHKAIAGNDNNDDMGINRLTDSTNVVLNIRFLSIKYIGSRMPNT